MAATNVKTEIPSEQKMAADIQMTKTETLEKGQQQDVSTVDYFTPDPAFERKLVRKLDLLTIPMMILIYFLS